jgi:hypothetical protein
MEFEGEPFSDTLREIENGRFVDDLTRDLRKIVNAALETRKDGSLAITLKVSPTGRGAIEVSATHKASIPEHSRSKTTFFATPEGTLMRDDPRQEKLPLRAVEEPREPLRRVD